MLDLWTIVVEAAHKHVQAKLHFTTPKTTLHFPNNKINHKSLDQKPKEKNPQSPVSKFS